MSENEPSLELMRKRFLSCQQVYRDCLSEFTLQDAAAHFDLAKKLTAKELAARHNASVKKKQAEAAEQTSSGATIIYSRGKNVKLPVGPVGGGKRGRPPKTTVKPEETQVLSPNNAKLYEQAAWLRQAQAKIDELFKGSKHAETLRADIKKLYKDINDLIDAQAAGKKFKVTGTPEPTELYAKGVKAAVRVLKKATNKTPAVSEMSTRNARGELFYTSFVYVRDVADADFYVVAISESLSTGVENRTQYYTMLSGFPDVFDPLAPWTDASQLEESLRISVNEHFAEAAKEAGADAKDKPAAINEKDRRIVRRAITGVDSTELVNNVLRVRLKAGVDPAKASERLLKELTAQVNQSNPKYKSKLKKLTKASENAVSIINFTLPNAKAKFDGNARALAGSVARVEETELLGNGKLLRVVLKVNSDPKEVGDAVKKALAANPKYKTVKRQTYTKREPVTTISISAPPTANRPKFKDIPVLKYLLNIASVVELEDTASAIDLNNLNLEEV
jgi:hypothetical protein